MKKIYLSMIAIAALALTACGGGNKSAAPANEGSEATAEAQQEQVEKSYDDMTEAEQFEAVIKRDYGFSLADVKPDAPFSEDATKYEGMPEPGHRARATFKKADGNYSKEEVDAYITKLYELTKAKSQDGKNVLGFGFSNDDPAHALDEASLESVLKQNVVQDWCFRVGDRFWVCKIYAPEGESLEVTFVDGITKSLDEAVKDADKVMRN